MIKGVAEHPAGAGILNMKDKIEEHTRRQIEAFLPDAIYRALISYQQFSEQEAPDEAKEFTAHHNACKVAIAHIELLIKLARWADLPGDDDNGNHSEKAMLKTMVATAEQELEKYRDHNENEKVEG